MGSESDLNKHEMVSTMQDWNKPASLAAGMGTLASCKLHMQPTGPLPALLSM